MKMACLSKHKPELPAVPHPANQGNPFSGTIFPVETMHTKINHICRRLSFELRYFRHPPWDTGISPPELYAFLEAHPPGSALDLGCGTGTNVITLATHGWQVTGVDFSRQAIHMARRKLAAARIEAHLEVADATRLEKIHGPFNLILDIGCLHGIPPDRRPAYYLNLERLLANEGTYLLYAFWHEPGSESTNGLLDSDLETLSRMFYLKNRQDGSDRGRRPSTWFTFTRRSSQN